MKFYPRRRRSAPPIIIISLIDVLIVMLVFLLVTSSFKNQPSIKIVLPETTAAPKQGAGAEKPPVLVTVQNAEPHLWFGTRPITEDGLVEELKAAVGRDADVNLVLRVDQDTPLKLLVKCMDLAGKSGVGKKNLKFALRGQGQK